MRKMLWKFGEYLQGVSVNDTAKIILGVIGLVGAIITIQQQPNPLLIFIMPGALIVALLVYFAIVFFSTEILHWFGSRFIKLSKWYPEFYYRPRFSYYLNLDYQGALALNIKSLRGNRRARLRLKFHRIKLIGERDEQKYQMAVDTGNVRNKLLYDKEIFPNDVRIVILSGKSSDGRYMLSFPFDYFGIALFPGRYVYEFQESGTHKDADFGGKTKRVEFSFDGKGCFIV